MGILLVLDGLDGSGKSTQAALLQQRLLLAAIVPQFVLHLGVQLRPTERNAEAQ